MATSRFRPQRAARPALAALIVFLAAAGAAGAAGPPVWLKQDGGAARAAVARITAGNGIYSLHVADGADFSCGTWTATTGSMHPAGFGEDVLFGSGFPGTSNTVLRSYASGNDYATGGSFVCNQRLCDVAAPTVTLIQSGSTTTGVSLSWTFVDAGTTWELTQEVNVEGPVDGTETIDNSAVRETHRVRNLGLLPAVFGLRKMWDWQVGSDDGPWFGDCATPALACDRSMTLTADGSGDGVYPRAYVIHQDPTATLCPTGVIPINPAGCGGNPVYLVAGTTSPPSRLTPAPDPPESLQFNGWSTLSGVCWEPALDDSALCGDLGSPIDDTASAYFYGRTLITAESALPGETRSYTQYVVAITDSCPPILEPCAPQGPTSPASPASPCSLAIGE